MPKLALEKKNRRFGVGVDAGEVVHLGGGVHHEVDEDEEEVHSNVGLSAFFFRLARASSR